MTSLLNMQLCQRNCMTHPSMHHALLLFLSLARISATAHCFFSPEDTELYYLHSDNIELFAANQTTDIIVTLKQR